MGAEGLDPPTSSLQGLSGRISADSHERKQQAKWGARTTANASERRRMWDESGMDGGPRTFLASQREAPVENIGDTTGTDRTHGAVRIRAIAGHVRLTLWRFVR